MKSRERVLTALNHKEPDRIPLDLGVGKACKFHSKFYDKLIDYLGYDEETIVCLKATQLALASDAVLEHFESDVRCAFPPFLPGTAAKETQDDTFRYYVDDWGTTRRMPLTNGLYYDICDVPIKDPEDAEELARYRWPGLPAVNPAAVSQAQRYQQAGYPVIFPDHLGDGFLQNAPCIMGYENWLMLLLTDEDIVHQHLDKLLEIKITFWDRVFDSFGTSLDIICESDDLGTQKAPFISVELFQRLFKPYYRKLIDHIKKRSDAKFYLHCCGSVAAFIPDFIDVGVDILNPVQITADNMDPVTLKKEFGKDIAFWGGGIDTQNTLPNGTPQQVRDCVKRNMEALAKDGGFVFAAVHNIQQDVPIENLYAMWDTFREYRNYGGDTSTGQTGRSIDK